MVSTQGRRQKNFLGGAKTQDREIALIIASLNFISGELGAHWAYTHGSPLRNAASRAPLKNEDLF